MKKAEKQLRMYEEKLGLAERFEKIKSETEEISKDLKNALGSASKEESDVQVAGAIDALALLDL